ncbi:MAG: ubiquinone/menaquinone biosynthesis methyltransferase [Chloroflexi bacterium]|nr:ubiquinone/menaquinone biosynthesis methyltransferase [Chloroflexota bacterium]
MNHLTRTERARFVQTMFGRIAERYDLLNRIMSFGQDVHWREEAIQRLEIRANTAIIDLGSGTGDIAMAVANEHPTVFMVASDFTSEMIRVGKQRPDGNMVAWVIADTEQLPFADESFAGVISGFLLRNVSDITQALAEQHRLLASDGKVVSLETTPPRKNLLRPLLNFHLNHIIPILGKIIAGDAEAYTYLSSSTKKFLTVESLAEHFNNAGFMHTKYVRRMFGTVGIHWGEKV